MTRATYFIRIAFRNLSRHWRRSLAAILSIASGFMALNLFEGYIADAENLFDITYSQRLMYGDILIQRKDAFQNGMWDDGTHQISSLELEQLEKILNEFPEITNRVRFLNMNGLITNGQTTSVFAGLGYDIEAGHQMRLPSWEWNTVAGRPLDGRADAAVIGQGLGRILDCVPTQKFKLFQAKGGYTAENRPFRCRESRLQLSVTNLSGQINATTVAVEGIVDAVYSEIDNRFIAIPLAKAQVLVGTDGISYYATRLKDHSQSKAFVGRLNDRLARASLNLNSMHWKDHPYGDIYVRSMIFLNVFRLFTLAVVLVVVTLSVVSTLIRLVQERTREIATLRSLGFKSRQVLILFFLESIFLAALGNFSGAVGTWVLAAIANTANIYYKIGILAEDVPFHIILPLTQFVFSALVLTVLTIGATVVATRRSLRMKITEGLAFH